MSISKTPWRISLGQTLRRLRRPERPPKVAVVGVGHELRGDDAGGVLLARKLLRHVGSAAPDRLLVVDAGPAPESYTGALRRFGPDLVLIVDAAQLGGPPGTVEWLAWQAIGGLGASSHTLPLEVLAAYLVAELGCEVALLGIQPADIAFDRPISPAVRRSVARLARQLVREPLLLEAEQQ